MDSVEIPFLNYHRASSFFYGQTSGHEISRKHTGEPRAPAKPLRIRGIAPGTREEVDFYQGIVLKALEDLGWEFEFVDKAIKSAAEFHAENYDLSFDRSHVDATLDPDFIRLLFKSQLGPRYQDPNERVSKILEKYDSGALPYRDLLIDFNAAIADEAAIIPLYHRGFSYTISDNIDPKSLTPLMSILRYEEIKLLE